MRSRDLPGMQTASGLKNSSKSGPNPDFYEFSKEIKQLMVCGHFKGFES